MRQRPDPEKRLEAGGLRRHRGAQAALTLAQLSGDKDWLQQFMKLAALREALRPPMHPFSLSPGEEVAEGDLTLGGVLEADGSVVGEARVWSADLTGGLAVFGATDSGKTRLVAYLIRQMAQRCAVWVFDPHGEHHRFFAEEIRAGQIIVLDYKQLRRNLLEPLPGEPLEEAIGRIASVFRRATFIRDGGENLLRVAIGKLYRERSVFEGGVNYPSVFDLKAALGRMSKLSFREAEYHAAVTNRLEGIVTQLGRTYGCAHGFPVAEMLRHSIIFRVGGLDPMTYAFFCDDLLTAALTCWRLGNAA